MFLSWRRRPLGLKSATAPEDAKRASDEVEAQRNNASLCVQGSFQAREEVRRKAFTPGWRGGARWRSSWVAPRCQA